jgi:quercetin dioxygenase-like cupin family protein
MSAPDPYVVQPGEAELRWLGDTSTYFLATGETTGGEIGFVDERAMLGESVPLHRHPDDVESFYVLEGEVSFFLGDAPGVHGGPGTFVHVPAGAVHGFRIESEEARYLILTTPHHAEFYRAITAASKGEPVTGDRIKAAAREYGVEFVGPLPDD